MNIPTGTDSPRPIQPTEGMMRDYEKEVDGKTYVFLEEYKNGEWVEVASMQVK
jgi:hypothetical protein